MSQQFKKNPNYIGGLWVNEGTDRDGKHATWLSGSIDLPDGSKLPIKVYKTTKKFSEKSPDFKVYKKVAKAQVMQQQQGFSSNEEDIPF